MLSFNQFINENRERDKEVSVKEFDALRKGNTVYWMGKNRKVEKSGSGLIWVKKDGDSLDKISYGQFKQRGGQIIKKESEENDSKK